MTAFSQKDSLWQKQQVDSLTKKLQTDSAYLYRYKKFRPYFKLDQRNSFIRSAPINVYGWQMGIQIAKRHIAGLGVYIITQKSKKNVDIKTNHIPTDRTLSLKYADAFYQYIIVHRKYVELHWQIEAGMGQYNILIVDEATNKTMLNKTALFGIVGLGPSIIIKPLKWIGVTAMTGYRFTMEKSTKINFNGLFYGYGVWINLGQIYRDVNFYWIKKRKYKKQVQLIYQPKSN
ncbi:MAG: hypothetical protein JST67_00120 [Bacteroidetes bacterium]|nr:hypothetical protein [Bacteroidota bacterium]